MEEEIIGIIPARLASQRLPKKMLREAGKKPLIQWTWENAKNARCLHRVIVATDDEEIRAQLSPLGAEVVMTSPDCPNGTARLAEVLEKLPELASSAAIINVQGDAPNLLPSTIEAVVRCLLEERELHMSTAVTPLRSKEERRDPSVVKCVKNCQGEALYFSRAPLPTKWRHLGIYGYRPGFLPLYHALPPTPMQLAEDLEQLKALERGYRIGVVEVVEPGIDINTAADWERFEELVCQ